MMGEWEQGDAASASRGRIRGAGSSRGGMVDDGEIGSTHVLKSRDGEDEDEESRPQPRNRPPAGEGLMDEPVACV